MVDFPLLTTWKGGYEELPFDNGVRYVGGCFEGCTSLVQVNLPKIQSVPPCSFRKCISLKSFLIPSGVTVIEWAAFFECKKLESFTIPDSVTGIGTYAFAHCHKLKNLTLSANLTHIGSEAFSCCYKLKNLTLPANLTYIGSEAFAACCNLTNLTLPSKLETIGDACFQGTGLTAITIPASVTTIGNDAFYNCEDLSSIMVDSRNPNYLSLDGALLNMDKTTLLAYAAGKDAISYSVPGTVSHVVYSAFYGSRNLKQLHVPGSVQGLILNSNKDKYYECEPLNKGDSALEDVFFFGARNIEVANPLKVYTGSGIKDHPLAASVKAGESAQFSVSAVGQNLSYQWQYKGPNATAWTDSTASGAKTATMKIGSVQGDHDGILYRCVVTLPSGKKMTSHYASLTVAGAPAIITQPAGKSGKVGSTVKFSVEAVGAGLQYQWQLKKPGTDTWANSGAAGAKTAGLSVEVKAGYNNLQYRCVITDAAGKKITSKAATLKVTPVITTQPADKSAKIGDTVKFTVAASGAGLKKQWQYSKDGGKTWVNSGASGNKTFTLSFNVTAGFNKLQYRCVITDANGKVVNSNPATLTVTPVLMTNPVKAVSAKVGDKVTLSVNATGAGLKKQWQYSSDGKTWKNSGAEGSKTFNLVLKASTGFNKLQYRCVITDANGVKLTSTACTLTIDPVLKSHPANKTASVGETAKFTVSATGASLKYQWYYSNDGGKTWTKSQATGSRQATLNIAVKKGYNGLLYRCVITDAGGNTLTSNSAKLTVK